MNVIANNSAKLNEIVFANKNKAYGAYLIRSEYNEALVKSLLFLMTLLFGVFGLAMYMNRNNQNNYEQKMVLVDDIKNDSTYTIVYHIEPPKQPITPPVNNDNASAAAAGGVATLIIDTAPTNTTVVNVNNPLNGKGPNDATGTSTTSTIVTTNTLSVVETNTTTAVTETVVWADDMPEFNSDPNGILRYVLNGVNYPPVAKEIGKEGTVYVTFVVSELGAVENIKVLKGIGYGCDEEVVRVITKMPVWKKPGKHNGKVVKVRYNIPVSFKLK